MATKFEMVLGILEKAPVVGLYMNQNQHQWDNFFKFYCKFLLSEEGPRGEVIKLSRQYLGKDMATTRQMIKPLGLTADYLVRDVYVKFKQYVPTPLYTRYQIDAQKLREVEHNSKLIVDNNSLMYKNIQKGLLQKHGDEYDLEGKMNEISQTYLNKCSQKQEMVRLLEEELNKSPEYIHYQKMMNYLEPVIEMFDKVEKNIGTSNVERGKLFEQKCRSEGLKEIYQRLGRDNFKIVVNCRWDPKELGEVDIAFIEVLDNQEIVTVLIQCKARLFDIMAADKQIGPERIQKNKKGLRVGKNVVPVSDKADYFIMTALPTNQYHLPFQSRLKVELQRATKPLSYAQLDAGKLYEILLPKFQGEMSPLQWMKLKGERHLIVI